MTTPHQPQPHTDGWQEMSSAPRHRGAKILGWCVFAAGAEVRLCQNEPPYLNEGPEPFWYAYGCRQNVILWQPLPNPPSTTQSQNGETE